MKPEFFQEAPPILQRYLGYLETVKGKSEKTVTEYYLDLRTFFRYLKVRHHLVPADTPFEEISIDDVDLDLIRTVDLTMVFEYLNYVGAVRNNAASTRSRKVSSLRGFFQYLTTKVHLLDTNPIAELETPKTKTSLPKYLTLEQSMDLLNAVDGSFKERDYCIITLFLNCGMRLSELVNINLNDIRRPAPPNLPTVTITGKGNKERMIYLNDACIQAIDDYLNVRPHDGIIDKEALFLSKRKTRISPKTVQHMVNENLKKIGLGGPGYSVHKLRHTAATLMYQYGDVDIRVLKDILGHENLGTTQIYTHISNQQMADAVSHNPLSTVKKKKK
ncbi:MAG: tyrosine recombinase XerC [Oscillospiraceae bacterium]|nr:tyrosine recombinase XerC [Oscillospiraceae bacterium]